MKTSHKLGLGTLLLGLVLLIGEGRPAAASVAVFPFFLAPAGDPTVAHNVVPHTHQIVSVTGTDDSPTRPAVRAVPQPGLPPNGAGEDRAGAVLAVLAVVGLGLGLIFRRMRQITLWLDN